jgi:Coenzyme PQQ synthesis protein D (PqqD)
MITSTATFTIPKDILARELEGEMVLLDPYAASYFSLNHTGTRVWQLLHEKVTVEEICQSIAEQYELSGEAVRTDLIPFLEELLQAGLIQST